MTKRIENRVKLPPCSVTWEQQQFIQTLADTERLSVNQVWQRVFSQFLQLPEDMQVCYARQPAAGPFVKISATPYIEAETKEAIDNLADKINVSRMVIIRAACEAMIDKVKSNEKGGNSEK